MSPAKKSRSYRQYCGLARALDVIGDRWTLLIIRELLIGPRRFGELHEDLCGVATNLLSQRLRKLEADGLIERTLGGPAEGIRYVLTPRGEALRAAIDELIRWSAPLMGTRPEGDYFRTEWLAIALPALLPQASSSRVTIGLETRGTKLLFEAGPTGSHVRVGRDEPCLATLQAEPEVILGLASGALNMDSALRRGARVVGNREAIERLFGHRPSGAREA